MKITKKILRIKSAMCDNTPNIADGSQSGNTTEKGNEIQTQRGYNLQQWQDSEAEQMSLQDKSISNNHSEDETSVETLNPCPLPEFLYRRYTESEISSNPL